jgi:hypothetical protein
MTDPGARCPECGSSSIKLVWAAMNSWDWDSWVCHRGHTFAGLPSPYIPKHRKSRLST